MSKYGTNWRYSKDTDSKGNSCWRIDSSEISLIAVLIYPNEQQRDENEHYAKLIKAAPQLLEACKQAGNVLAGLITGDLKEIKADSATLAQLREAIKAATE